MNEKVTITPMYNVDQQSTTLTIRGLREGARIVVGVVGAEEDYSLFVGKRGLLHVFGESSDGPIALGCLPR